MTAFTITEETALSPADAFARLSDFAGHGKGVPLTRMLTDPGAPRLGWSFTGRTAIGRIGFGDHMVITMWSPPTTPTASGSFRVVKIGSWLHGWAEVTIEPRSGKGASVTWTEELSPGLDPFPRLTGPIAAAIGTRIFRKLIRDLLSAHSR